MNSLWFNWTVIKRISRFFKNKLFNPYSFYDKIIHYIISNYKVKHNDNRIHIVFDHMFSHNNYTTFMITMRIGSSGFPLWFRYFKGVSSDTFKEDMIMEGISYVSNLFGKDYELIFSADRWFNSIKIMKHIKSLGHIFTLRLRRNMKLVIYDKKEKRKIWKWVDELTHYSYHSKSYVVYLTEEKYEVTLILSKKKGTKDPWIIVANGNPKRTVKDYDYRFGVIETVFKSQKSNGFYLESTCNASIEYFTSMYTIACFAQTYMTILGADFAKNRRCYRNVKITTHKNRNGKKVRTMSLFNTGLTLFHLAYISLKYIRIPFNFKLYDV